MNNLEKEAVALEYGKNDPIITAKGEAELADIIIQEAKKQGIYCRRPKIIISIGTIGYRSRNTRGAFTAVAVILSWVYWLKEMEP